MRVRSFEELMAGHERAEIVCMVKRVVVRRLEVIGGLVHIDALSGPTVSVPLGMGIEYEPWVMDRGNMLFECPEVGGRGKICTEGDLVRFPGGREETIMPWA